MRLSAAFFFALLLATASPPPAGANFNEPPEAVPSGDPDFDAGYAAIKAADWTTAIDRLQRAAKKHTRSADLHNLLGFAYRKSGDLERSFLHYGLALDLDPEHRGAHEYIGEAWLMRGDLAKAREHLGELERLCRSDCEEYHDLGKAISEFESQRVPR